MTPDLDALAALLAHYGTVDGVGHEDDGHGGCVLCFVHVPYTDDEHLVVRYPCAFAALPSLIEAARREAALVDALRALLAACEPLFPDSNWTIGPGDGFTVALDKARSLLHDNAGATEPAEGTE